MNLLLAIVLCCPIFAAQPLSEQPLTPQASATQPQSAQPPSPPITSSIFDVRNDPRYGGAAAAAIYDAQAGGMPQYLESKIRMGSSLDDLMQISAITRQRIACESHTLESNAFGTDRRQAPPLDQTTFATPVYSYPVMREVLVSNLRNLRQTSNFVQLDDTFEYCFRILPMHEWLPLIQKEADRQNFLDLHFLRIIKGKSESSNLNDWDKTPSFGWHLDIHNDPTLVDFRYDIALKRAFQDYVEGKCPDTIKLGLVQFRFLESDVYSRTIFFPFDTLSQEDYSNVPFGIIHPNSVYAQFNMGGIQSAYEAARLAKSNHIIRILRFSYLFALAMPYRRGSAAINEWITGALCHYHKQGQNLPFKLLDQIAQGSFTFRQFIGEVSKERTIPRQIRSGSKYLSLEQYFQGPFQRTNPIPASPEAPASIKDQLKTILILTPPVVTGGPENLCQLALELQTRGFTVYMIWFQGLSRLFKVEEEGTHYLHYLPEQDLTPAVYRKNYNVKYLDRRVPLDASTLVVIPEPLTDVESFFKPAHRLINWLSLGNFEISALSGVFKYAIPRNKLGHFSCLHTSQAPWIQKQLTQWGVNALPLHDYLSSHHHQAITETKIENTIAYFPRKGGQLAQKFMAAYPGYSYMKIDGLDSAGVRKRFEESKIYIDFGHFPGKDRSPREALLAGCVIFLHNKGCATDRDSFPIDDRFRFEEADIENGALKSKIDDVLAHFTDAQAQQNAFRESIRREREIFQAQVLEIFGIPLQ